MENNENIVKYLHKIIDADKTIKRGIVEEVSQGALIPYWIKNSGKEVIIYGGGRISWHIFSWLKFHDISPLYVIDAIPSECAMKAVNEIKIISREEYRNLCVNGNNTICINSVRNESFRSEIYDYLHEVGINQIYEIDLNDIMSFINIDFVNYFLNNIDKIEDAGQLFSDFDSKNVFSEYLRCIFMGDFYREKEYPCFMKYWGQGENCIFTLGADENLLCIGGSNGDTIFYFIDVVEKYNHIYCFEGDAKAAKQLRLNISALSEEQLNKITLINKFVSNITQNNETKIDDTLEIENVSIITLDIEGMECKALEGMKSTIIHDRPIVALSAYHKANDIINFMDFFLTNVNKYKFYLRKYASRKSMPYNEIVFYAVPNERVIK